MFINNLETGLRREKGTFLGLDYTFIKAIESSNIKAYFTKRTPNMGGSISEAKYIQETLKKKRIKDKEMASLIDNMIRLEDFVGEEYLTTINLGTLQLIVEHAKMDQESLEKVVQWIIEDEKRHATIMKRIRVLITR